MVDSRASVKVLCPEWLIDCRGGPAVRDTAVVVAEGRIKEVLPRQQLVIPEGAVVVPGARAVTAGKGPEWGLALATPVIVKYRDSRTDTRTELEAWIR